MENILITGSRKFIDASFIYKILKKELKEGDVIIHGGAQGADSIAQEFCDENNFCACIVRPIYPAKRESYLHRNAEMVGMCDRVIAFWDGQSRGTWFTIDYAKKRNLFVKIYREGEDGK